MKMKALLLVFSPCLSARLFAAELSVNAAASLTDAMKEIGAAYESGDAAKARET